MGNEKAGPLVEVTRPRAAWAEMLESVERCHRELFWLTMAYRDEGWREVDLTAALISLLRAHLGLPGDRISIRLTREGWLRHLDAFRYGVEHVRSSWEHGQANPASIANSPDRLAFPSIEASWRAFLAALPGDCRDTERVCYGCERLLPLAQFARELYCHDCYAQIEREVAEAKARLEARG